MRRAIVVLLVIVVALAAAIGRDWTGDAPDEAPASVIAPQPPNAAIDSGASTLDDSGTIGGLACSTPGQRWPEAEAPPSAAASEPTDGVGRIGALARLDELYGEAPDATVGRVRIPVLGVDAPLGERPVEGEMLPSPTGPGDVVWYDLSDWSGFGGVPGAGQNAVFSGHVDFFGTVPWADVTYRGPGVFKDLELLTPGDVIELEVCGELHRYEVVWLDHVSASDGDWGTIFSSDVARDSVTLVTCGGAFDSGTRTYAERVVVRAEQLPAS